jgi:hypothetical protein
MRQGGAVSNRRGEFREVAEKIARRLFVNGHGQHAKRLVLELPGDRDGGGWAESAVADQVEKILEEYASGGEAVALLSRKNRVGAQLVKGLKEFLSKVKSGEPITVTRVEQEMTPDGPLTTRKKKTI